MTDPQCTGPFSDAFDCPVHDPRKRATTAAQAETPDRIAEIRQREQQATTGPWPTADVEMALIAHCFTRFNQTESLWTGNTKADAEFIANARQDIPYLLDLVASLQSRLQQADADLAAIRAEQAGLTQLRDDAQTENALLNAEVTRLLTALTKFSQ